ncbi:MAG: SAM-dependent methyltransferase [Gammaproteobacteria bacterium]|nr:SAM-dependent methyltransferase [Gammaproteobacteria bacterium]
MTSTHIPTPIERGRSELLAQKIRTDIENHGGQISFARYMAMALYTPELGYYNSDQMIFGRSGDFMTAPEYSSLFATCIAETWKTFCDATSHKQFVEMGAGSGKFAYDFLLQLQQTDYLPERYIIIEVSNALRKRQQALLQENFPEIFSRIEWHNTLPPSFSGMIFANEVLDALPVHCFRWQNNLLLERCVGLANQQFIWTLRPASDALRQQCMPIIEQCALSPGYQSEIRLVLHDWIHQLAENIRSAALLMIDYGYGRNEYYHPARTNGTLTCFYQHQQLDNPFHLPGLTDITAHVDFTATAEAFSANQLHLNGFTTQAAFLLETGILQHAEIRTLSPQALFEQSQAIKRLTMPSEMGETVKVILATTDSELKLPGFSLQDKRHTL